MGARFENRSKLSCRETRDKKQKPGDVSSGFSVFIIQSKAKNQLGSGTATGAVDRIRKSRQTGCRSEPQA